MEKQSNPIQVVQVRNTDHKKISYDGFGSPTVFGDGATEELRGLLAEQTAKSMDFFAKDFELWPRMAGIVKVTLREEALAKTHRPLNLFSSRTCPIIGTLGFGELLISASRSGLEKLHERLLTGSSQKVIANISAVEKIEPYSQEDRLQGLSASYISTLIGRGETIKLKLFDHQNDQKNMMVTQAFNQFAQEHNIQLKKLNYGSSYGLIAATIKNQDVAKKLTSFIGLRSVSPIPRFKVTDMEMQTSSIGHANSNLFPQPDTEKDYPVVGIIDSGICPKSTLISPWVIARESYVPPGLEDYTHGTMVAGLIVNSRPLNHQDERFPESQAKIVDVNVFPKDGSTSEDDLVAIIEEVVRKYPEVKVWNLSLGGVDPVHDTDFSDLAHFLDEMHDLHNCLFVVAAGNQSDTSQWPTRNGDPFINRISSPGDSIRALTVGSLAHKATPLALCKEEQVSPFSRIGPGPSCIPKPEITHYGGNVTANGAYAQIGILSLGPNNMLCESIGTSFSTPIVSSIAANLHHFFSEGTEQEIPTERIKALIIHSALLGSCRVSSDSINYYGFGRPGDIVDHLYCDPNCMTMIFETDLRHGGFEFERFPFPIPDCLNTSDGKFKGEILMTLVYSPELDKNFASEYCRINVDVGMGSYNQDKDGVRRFNSMVPAAPKDLKDHFEKSRVDNGFKWSSVKAYHKISTRGINVGDWRLKLSVLRRAEMEIPDMPQRATLVLSLRGLDPLQPVYNETIQKMNQMGWSIHDIDQHMRIRN
ncbi:S8 family anti-phage peptidase IteS [Aeromonas enteropelogenes]|uniref:S8 family anti-phage peptidase IteS n=1 Tax=Aeromonas enteropelogenes TaxID=29489 RepID=UPI003BA2A571